MIYVLENVKYGVLIFPSKVVVQKLNCRKHSSAANLTLQSLYVPPVAATWFVPELKWIMYLKSASSSTVAIQQGKTWFIGSYCVLCSGAALCIHIRLWEELSIKMLTLTSCKRVSRVGEGTAEVTFLNLSPLFHVSTVYLRVQRIGMATHSCMFASGRAGQPLKSTHREPKGGCRGGYHLPASLCKKPRGNLHWISDHCKK